MNKLAWSALKGRHALLSVFISLVILTPRLFSHIQLLPELLWAIGQTCLASSESRRLIPFNLSLAYLHILMLINSLTFTQRRARGRGPFDFVPSEKKNKTLCFQSAVNLSVYHPNVF